MNVSAIIEDYDEDEKEEEEKEKKEQHLLSEEGQKQNKCIVEVI